MSRSRSGVRTDQRPAATLGVTVVPDADRSGPSVGLNRPWSHGGHSRSSEERRQTGWLDAGRPALAGLAARGVGFAGDLVDDREEAGGLALEQPVSGE